MITATAALDAGVRPSDEFFDPGYYDLPGYRVVNYQRKAHGRLTLAEALAFSVNVIFAKIAVGELEPERLAQAAEDFGYGDPYDDFPIPVTGSSLNRLAPDQWTTGTTAQTSFGQNEASSNVFEMGLVTAAVANGGEMMEPRVVHEVRSPEGVILDKPSPSVRRRVTDEDTAGTVNRMMQGVVTTGGLSQAEVPGAKVAAKTGTAEDPPREPHSWFVSFAPADDPEIAVAVMIENGGEIGPQGAADTPAVPIAQDLMEAYLERGRG